MALNMGLGTIGGSNIVFKRKYRWTFAVRWGGKDIPTAFVKVANRPNLSIEQTEINYLHGKMWIPGKGTWETLTVSYYDMGGAGATGMTGLWDWLTTVYNFSDPTGLKQTSIRGADGTGTGWAGLGVLTMYDGTGEQMETWELANLWPAAINFGDLDYGSSDVATLDLTLRFSEARWTPFCGIPKPNATPQGCGG
jgi:hypothetical protein